MKIQTKTWIQTNWQDISWFCGLIIVASILPRFIHNQFITGPIVNATLFLAAYILGSGSAILVGLVPSVVALSSGLLPVTLAPIVPFIMISNAILILVFNGIKKMTGFYGVSAIAASLIKYLFLYISVSLVTNLIAQKTIALKAATIMMAWPQLVTALAGAIVAFGILKLINKIK